MTTSTRTKDAVIALALATIDAWHGDHGAAYVHARLAVDRLPRASHDKRVKAIIAWADEARTEAAEAAAWDAR